MCVSLVSISFVPLFFIFLVFWFHTKFGSACYMPRYFLLQRRRRLLPSEHRLWAALWTARCLVFNPIFIVSTHLSLGLGLGLGPASMGMEMQMEMGMWKVHFHWNSSSSNHNNKGNFMFNSLK